MQGNTDNSDYGAENTVTSTYKIVENPNEAACKAYVQNGLAKKLDKTGGVITGSLIVEGGTKTSLKGFVSRSEEGTFGMVYDLSSKAFMLGFGEVDEDGNFSFSEGEGLPVTLREDSSAFEDGTVVQWSSDGNKLVPTDLRVEDIATLKELAEVEAQIPTDTKIKDYAKLDGDNVFTGNNTFSGELNGTATNATNALYAQESSTSTSIYAQLKELNSTATTTLKRAFWAAPYASSYTTTAFSAGAHIAVVRISYNSERYIGIVDVRKRVNIQAKAFIPYSVTGACIELSVATSSSTDEVTFSVSSGEITEIEAFAV